MKKQAHTARVYREESRLFYGALCLCLLVVCAYMYFVSMSVVHVVMRKEVDTEIALLSTKISKLEETYIEKQHHLSTAIAEHRGFVIAEEKIFVDKSGVTLVLSNN